MALGVSPERRDLGGAPPRRRRLAGDPMVGLNAWKGRQRISGPAAAGSPSEKEER
jgi:hypothetical protein